MYVIVSDGRAGINLFLVDRSKIKDRWWSSDVDDAKLFTTFTEGKRRADKLLYRNPEVIDLETARMLSRQNDTKFYDEHPFSSEGLGQS